MPPGTTAEASAVERWLGELDRALARGDAAALAGMFSVDSHWRDVLALTWDIRTLNGPADIARELVAHGTRARATGFSIAEGRAQPREVTRAGTRAIEAIFTFETGIGRCNGVVRLAPEAVRGGKLEAWTLMTALDEIKGHEERGARAVTVGKAFSRDFHGPNWLDLRTAAVAYADRDPTVLVVGAGQAGMAIGARLTQLGVDTLVVDRHARIGDNWRHRYHALTLHNQTHVNHFPYMPFPPGWPTYIPKDKLANWFEAYAEAMEINCWTGTTFEGGDYDEKARRWSVTLGRADGTRRHLRPRHLVMATGVSGIPHIPEIATLERFKGKVLHTSHFGDSAPWRDKRALVIGTGTSGHDIAQDLCSNGAKVAIVQRASTMVVNIEPSAQLPYTLYEEGPPLADCDLITVGTPFALLKRGYQLITAAGREHDRPLLERLQHRGFRLDFGEQDTGWQFKYLTRGGGYYFNVGCSELIADGAIDLFQFTDIAEFVPEGARLESGATVAADLVVLATGYKGQEQMIANLLGAEVTRRLGPIWGFGDGQELRNMFKRTAQPGLWFIAGSFAQCRIYSKYLALQIKGCEIGLIELQHPSRAAR